MEVDPEKHSIKVVAGTSSEVWRGLEVIGELERSVTHLGDLVFSSCIEPLLSSGTTSMEVSIERGDTGLICSCKAFVTEDLRDAPLSKLQGTQKIFEFLAEHLFQGIGTLTQIVGDTTWGKLQEIYLKQVAYKTTVQYSINLY